MANIYNLKINTSDIPAAVTSRGFTVTGDIGAKFILCVVQEGTLKYYDFRDNSFELGHNDKHNNLEVTMSRTVYNGNIIFLLVPLLMYLNSLPSETQKQNLLINML